MADDQDNGIHRENAAGPVIRPVDPRPESTAALLVLESDPLVAGMVTWASADPAIRRERVGGPAAQVREQSARLPGEG